MDGGGIPPVLQRDKKPSAYRPGGEGGNGPPEGKFTRLGGKVTFGVLSSKINVIRANKRAISLLLMNKPHFHAKSFIFRFHEYECWCTKEK